MEKTSKSVIKTAMFVSIIILLSKVAGFIRDIIFSSTFGISVLSDAYTTANGFVGAINLVFTVGISSVFIPMYTKISLNNGKKFAGEYANNVINLYILLSILISAICYIFAPQISSIIWFGEKDVLPLITEISRTLYPFLVFYAISGVFVNILNANKSFLPEQIMGLVLSFCIIFACIVSKNIMVVAIATSIAAVMQFFMLLPFVKSKHTYKKTLSLKGNALKQTFKLSFPSIISIAFDDINAITDRIFASSIATGVVSSIKYSFTLVNTVIGVLIVPLTTIMYPELSTLVAQNRMERVKYIIRRSLELVLLLTLPIIIISVICSKEIIGIVYQRGEFSEQDTIFSAPVFAFYIIGILGFAVKNFLTRAFFSMQSTKIPTFIGIFSVSVNIILDFAFKETLGARGLTLATSIAGSTGAFLMILALNKKMNSLNLKQSLPEFWRIIFCGLVTLIIVIITYNLINCYLPNQEFRSYVIRFLACTLIGMSTFAIFTYILKVYTTRFLLLAIQRKFKKKNCLNH